MILPKGWAIAELEELSSKIGSGATPRGGRESYAQNGIPLIRSMNIHFAGFKEDGLAFINEDQARLLDGVKIEADDVLLNITGASIGRVCLAPSKLAGARVNQHVCIIRTVDGIVPRYVQSFLAAPEMQRFILEENYGLTRQALTKEMIQGIKVPLPPIAEQRRIVAKLDVLTARLARARAELERVTTLAKALRLHALQATFHWQTADQDLPKGWSRKRVDEIGAVQLGRQRSPKDHSGPHMRPYVRAANITWSGLDLSDIKEMNFTPEEYDVFRLEPGDVLLNEGSGSASEVGKSSIWNGEIKNACFQNTVLRVRPYNYDPKLLRYCFLYIALSGQFIQNTKGVNIIHIGKAGLAKKVIPVPPVGEQELLLNKIETVFARAERLEVEAARALILLDRLEAAIHAKAFRGELVSQDPADEPASVLLERIRTQRASAPMLKRKRFPKA